jgi:hypothetical protein
MKILVCVLFYSFSQLAFSQDEQPYFSLYNQPKKGYTTYTFMPTNELKESPRADSKTKIVLPINTKIIIDTVIEIDYSKPNSYQDYYRVKYKGKVGYLKSEEVALTRFELPKFETHMLFKLRSIKADENSSGLQLHYKELYHDTLVYEKFFDLNGYLFQLDLTGTRGLDSIENL